MRLFTALDAPEALRQDLADLQHAKELSVRWSDPEKFHITLRFIGEVPEEQAIRYENVLADVRAPSVECVPYGVDVLPSRRSPRVLMLGLKRTDSMMTLYENVTDALQSEGLEREDRKYRPHLTIGRLDEEDPESVHDFLRRHEERAFPSFEADRFILYESILTPDGAVHEPQAIYPLPS